MTTLATGAAGAAIGGWIGGPMGAQMGWLAGVAIGGALFGEKVVQEGPRLEDRVVQVSTYGLNMSRIYGTIRVTGNVIWTTDLKETRHENSVGGKGGGQSYTEYTYSVSFAVSICQGDLTGLRRIWADGKLILDYSETNNGKAHDFQAAGFKYYSGTEDQLPDPTIQAHMGQTPAYRGQAYVVFTDLQLKDYGNRIPNLSFEVTNGDQASFTRYSITPASNGVTGANAQYQFFHPVSGFLWGRDDTTNIHGQTYIYCVDPFTNNVIGRIGSPSYGTAQGRFGPMGYDSLRNQIVVLVRDGSSQCWVDRYDCDTYMRVGSGLISDVVPFFDWVYKTELIYNPGRDAMWLFGSAHPFLGPQTWEITPFGATPFAPDYMPSAVNFTNLQYIADSNLFIGCDPYHKLTAWSAADYSKLWEFVGAGTVRSDSIDYGTYDSLRKRFVFAEGNSLKAIDIENGNVVAEGTVVIARGIQAINYVADMDVIILGDDEVTGQLHMVHVNPETLQVTDRFDVAADVRALFQTGRVNPYMPDRVYYPQGDMVAYYPIRRFIGRSTYPLSRLITDESELVGVTAAEIDVSQLESIEVYGYAVSRITATRNIIEQLMVAYQFDAVESGGKIKFVLRKNASTVILDPNYLAAHEMGSDTPELMPIQRKDESELPTIVTTKFMDWDNDYQIGTQQSVRMTGYSKSEFVYDLPMALTNSIAKNISEIGLYSSWASRNSSRISTTIKYQKVEPTDLVSVNGNVFRVSKKTLSGNMVSLEGEWENGVVYTQEPVAAGPDVPSQHIPYITGTRFELMDIVALRDQDSDTGLYCAAGGFSNDTWPGCMLYMSRDLGVSWSQVSYITDQATIGGLVDPIAYHDDGTFDYTQAIRVRLTSGSLNSISELDLLNGHNTAVVGDEVLQFRIAQQIDDSTYMLTGFLRGRRGSPIVAHAAGTRFVAVSEATVIRIPMDEAEVGVSRLYRAATIRSSAASGVAREFINTANALECLSPVHCSAGRDSSGNVKFTWFRRARVGGSWSNYSDVPLGEETQSYSVEVYNGTTLVRTITSALPTADYSVANQIIDFGSAQSSIIVKIYQISATNGGGFIFSGAL